MIIMLLLLARLAEPRSRSNAVANSSTLRDPARLVSRTSKFFVIL